jgi:acyl-CoA thioesterase-1
MLELPLPPFYNEFGRAQRRVARRHGVLLVPRRVMLGVLLHGGSTVDSIHLSPSGHARMAEAIWGIIRGAYARGEDRLDPHSAAGPKKKIFSYVEY